MTAPDPPEGYRSPYEFHYSQVHLLAGSAVLLAAVVAALLAYAALPGRSLGVDVETGPEGVAIEMNAAALLAAPATVVAHEAIHAAVARALGYRVSWGVTWMVAYVLVAERYISRRDMALVAVAPLVVLSGVGVAGLLAGGPTVAGMATVLLVVNTSGVVGDLYLLYRTARLPPGSLFYDVDVNTMLIYEPA